jgi:glycosyltransferase involved in cell wall biosynthesis
VTPAFAVTIPAHGDGVLLREAVASVLAQDSDDWTLSVHDDGPDDAGLTDWFAGLDARVSYRRNDPRLGINRNFQHCLETADADLVTIMGADDRMLPSYVRELLVVLGDDAGAAAGRAIELDELDVQQRGDLRHRAVQLGREAAAHAAWPVGDLHLFGLLSSGVWLPAALACSASPASGSMSSS